MPLKVIKPGFFSPRRRPWDVSTSTNCVSPDCASALAANTAAIELWASQSRRVNLSFLDCMSKPKPERQLHKSRVILLSRYDPEARASYRRIRQRELHAVKQVE